MEKQIEEMAKVMANARFVEPDDNQIRLFIGEAEVLYNAGYRKQEWISVEEQLPENNGNIITYQGNSQEIDSYYYCGNGEVVDNRGDFASLQYYGITHWMPMPEPPKGVVDGKAD